MLDSVESIQAATIRRLVFFIYAVHEQRIFNYDEAALRKFALYLFNNVVPPNASRFKNCIL